MGEEGRTSKASRIGLEILGWLLLAAGVAALVLPGCQWPVCGPRFWPGESPHPCGSSSGFQGRPPGVVVSCEVEGRLRCRGRCSSTDRLRAGCPGRNVVTRNWRGCNETCAGIATPARDSPPVPELEGSTNRGTPRGQGVRVPGQQDVVLDLLELATAIRIAYLHLMPASARRGPLELCKGQAVRGFCGWLPRGLAIWW